jgi:acyl transferase domain-containing protein
VSLDAQAAVISEAQGVAGVSADTITCVEAHGTGTAIGDPIEIAALTKAFRAHTDRKQFCAVGSVKTNIGHLDATAGVAGLIKAVLALEHKEIPPSLNFETPNPRIDFENSPFYVNTALSEWKTNGAPRRAGVSSFGIGGTNAHVILEEAPAIEPAEESHRPWQLLALSAKTQSALETATSDLAAYLKQHPEGNLADIAFTLQVGRKPFEHRRILVCQTVDDAATALNDLDPQRVFSTVQETAERPVAFMFTGQGAQYVNMGLELYRSEPAFCEHVTRCCELLMPHLGFDLRDVLYPAPERVSEATERLEQTSITQPALFVIEYALARLWMEWGLHPQAMIGHSIGEYTAACLAGVFSLEDGLALVAARGRLMQQLPGGAMLAIPLPEQEVRLLLDGLSLAAVNGSSACVVSGHTAAIEALERRLASRGVACRRLRTSHAFHSAMMDSIVGPFAEQVERVTLRPPQIPCVSNVTGDWLAAGEATDPGYWANHLRQAVRFADGVRRLVQDPAQVLLEVGPGRTLTTLATRHPSKSPEQTALSSLRHPQDQLSDAAFLLTTLGKLWLSGAQVDWAGFHAHERRRRVSLPAYPFERQRYWIEPQEQIAPGRQAESLTSKKPDPADWFYVPSWRRSALPACTPMRGAAPSHWLVFIDEAGLGARLVERLEQEGHDVVTVQAGTEFARLGDRRYVVNPGQSAGYDALLGELCAQEIPPCRIVHLWNVTPHVPSAAQLEQLERTLDLAFYSLLFLAQALDKQNLMDDGVQIAVVSSNMQEVSGEETLCPEKATALGPIAVIPHEYPNTSCRSIDVAWPQPGSSAEGRIVDQVLAEIVAESPDLVVAYRGLHRWVQTFEAVRLAKSAEATPRLKPRGVYLITGGLGGVGLTLAKHLAATVQARLILTGRSALPDAAEWGTWLAARGESDPVSRKIHQVQELEALGAEVLIVQADVANLGQMQSAIALALERFGRIDGVIHAAGVPGGGMIALRTRETAESVMAPKVRGTLVLDAALRDVPLDFLVLCSSINSIVGRVGQADYYAANAFLDAYGHQRNAGGAPTVCINWDTWREVGMAAETFRQFAEPSAAAESQPGTASHPLFDRHVLESDEQSVYVTRFAVSKHWELHEHGILGKPTLPGTTYLEMARAVFENRNGNGAVEIRDAYFVTPLIVEDDGEREVYTVLKRQGDGFAFSVSSKAGDTWQEHAQGTIAALEARPAKRHDIHAIESRCNEQDIANPLEQVRLGQFGVQRRPIMRGSSQGKPLVVESIVIEESSAGQTRSMEFGARWHSLKRVRLGTNEGLALLELAPDFRADVQSYKLHPALLDFATSFLRLFQGQGSYLPLSYKSLRVHGALPERIYSYARRIDDAPTQGTTLRFDVTIMDDAGTELVEIEEFAVIRIDDASKLGDTSRMAALLTLSPDEIGAPGAMDARTRLLQEDLREGLAPTEGVDVFGRIMGSALPRVVVSTRDLSTRIGQSRASSLALLVETSDAASIQRPKHARPRLMNAYAAPRNETEQRLAEIWQDVLGIGQVGVHDNFFELGGDSLLITRIHSRFVSRFNREMSVASMLQYPTIADLAQFLSRKDSAGQLDLEQVQSRTDRQKEAMRRRKQKNVHRREAI